MANKFKSSFVTVGKIFDAEGNYSFSVTLPTNMLSAVQQLAVSEDVGYATSVLKAKGFTVPKGMVLKVSSDKKDQGIPDLPDDMLAKYEARIAAEKQQQRPMY